MALSSILRGSHCLLILVASNLPARSACLPAGPSRRARTMATVTLPGYDARISAFPELRDRAAWRGMGLWLTTGSDKAAKLLDLAFRCTFTRSAPRYFGLDPASVALAAVEADKGCAMAHLAGLALRLIGGSKVAAHVQPALAAAATACEAGSSEWERRHLDAVRRYASADDSMVGDMYTAIVRDFPADTLALSMAFIHNSPARRQALLHNTEAMLASWSSADDGQHPGDLFPFLLAEHAYSLGENERYEESEGFARRALQLEPTCALATHQMAHLFEMTGRAAVGCAFLRKTEANWRLGGQATHIYWHWAVMHVEKGEHDKALTVYEVALRTAKRDDASGARKMTKCVNDLASLLFRLHLDGMETERTATLAAEVLALPSVATLIGRSSGSAAVDVHLAMLLALTGQGGEATLSLSAEELDPAIVSARFVQAQALTTALCQAIVSYTRRDYATTVVSLSTLQTEATEFWAMGSGVHGVVPDAWRPLGLSNAQRDVCTQLYLRALIYYAEPGDVVTHRIVANMVNERKVAGKDQALTARLELAATTAAQSRL